MEELCPVRELRYWMNRAQTLQRELERRPRVSIDEETGEITFWFTDGYRCVKMRQALEKLGIKVAFSGYVSHEGVYKLVLSGDDDESDRS